MESKPGYDFKKTLVSSTGLLVLLVVLILVNVIFSYANIRWDATEDRIYSLSEGTKNILSEMAEPVTVKFFYSRSNRNLPANLKLYANRVREFLSEYETFSNGRVTVQLHDPKVDSDEEEWAQKYGMRPMRTTGGEMIYFGLVFLAAAREERIEWVDPAREELLEYDVTRIIHHLQRSRQYVVGIVGDLPVLGGPSDVPMGPPQPRGRPWLFVEELKKTYEVRELDPSTDSIDPSIHLLLIIHPKAMSPKTQYAVDQYVLSGGNAIIFVDPFCVSDRSQGRQRFVQPQKSSLDKLFSAWGLSMDSGKVVVDLDQPTRVRTGSGTVEDNPVWITARGDAFNKTDVVTSGLESMLFPLVGAIKKAGDSAYEFEPLVQSGKNSALADAFKANFGSAAMRRDFVPAGERFNMVVQVRGKFKTAFPAGPPKEDKSDASSKDKPGKVHLKAGKDTATLVVVADADLLADEFYVQRNRFFGFAVSKMFNDNLNFLSNACEIMTGSDDLIGLRSRGKFERPFTTVLELQRRAQERWLSKEKELVSRVEATNKKLRELEQQKDASQRLILSPEQEGEIDKFKEEKRRINRELKQVRKNLRLDIEKLGTTLKALNIFLMPILVSAAGVGFALYRQRKMKNQ